MDDELEYAETLDRTLAEYEPAARLDQMMADYVRRCGVPLTAEQQAAINALKRNVAALHAALGPARTAARLDRVEDMLRQRRQG